MFNRFLACTTQQDLIDCSDVRHVYQPISYGGIDTGVIANDSWGYNEAYQSAHVKTTTGTKKGSFELEIGQLKKGDSLNISAEILFVSGNVPRISILNKSISQIRDYFSSSKVSFDKVEIEFTTLSDGDYTVIVGTTSSEIAEFHLRNITVKITSRLDMIPAYEHEIKIFPIRTTDTGVFGIVPSYVSDGCTFDMDATTLKITFDKVFTGYGSSQNRVVGWVGKRASTPSSLYDIKVAVEDYMSTGSFITITFYTINTNTKLDPSTIGSGFNFDLFVMGFNLAK